MTNPLAINSITSSVEGDNTLVTINATTASVNKLLAALGLEGTPPETIITNALDIAVTNYVAGIVANARITAANAAETAVISAMQ